MSDGRAGMGRARRRVAPAVAGLLALVGGLLVAGPAHAGVGIGTTPTFPDVVTVGENGLAASIQFVNTSTGAQVTHPIQLSNIGITPSCATASLPCPTPDPGVLDLAPTATGRAGTACAGLTFTVTGPDPAGQYTLTPSGPVVLAPVGQPNSSCVIDLSFNVLKTPATDIDGNAGNGVQTRVVAAADAVSTVDAAATARSLGSQPITVLRAPTRLTTQASPAVPLGGAVSDTATLAVLNAATVPPSGTITFRLHGPDDATCATAPVFTRVVTVAGAGDHQSGPFTPTAPGTYRWTASYSGDANFVPAESPCNAPNESVTVDRAAPTIVTQATPTAPLGGPISDTATLSNGFNPTGTITFRVYGPDDATCGVAPAFTSAAVPVTGNGTYSSGPFTPTAAGTYRWRAFYSGDANNAPRATACNDPDESSVVAKARPAIVTRATARTTLTTPISDTATLSNGFNPTGTITFRVYGPDDATCAAAPAFTSAAVPVTGNGTYSSGPFTPTAAGTYRWRAFYSGDANNEAVNTACNDPDESSVVTPLPTIAVDKSVNPASRPEPGGTFTFTVVVTNTSPEVLTIRSLVDDIYGNLATRGTCTSAVGTALAASPGPNHTYTCAFTVTELRDAGFRQTDVVTVRATNPAGVEVVASDDATITITDVKPTVTVDKAASPLTRPEPGGPFTFTVVVTNTSAEAVTITSLTDDIYGNLATRGTCTTAVGRVLAASPGPNHTYTCAFDVTFTGNAGATQTDVVTVVVVDNDGSTGTDSDDAAVRITDVPPTIDVTKTPSPAVVNAPGGEVVFTVAVVNRSMEPVTIVALVDDVFGNLNGRGTCAIGAVVVPGGRYECRFTGNVSGAGGTVHTNEVTATAIDDDGSTATARARAAVTILEVAVLGTTPPSTLARTGSTPGGPLPLAAAMLAVGVLLVVTVRRAERA